MAEKTLVLRKLMGALVFERDGKRIDVAPKTVVALTTDEVKKLNAMNPSLLEYPSDDEVELYNLRNAPKTAPQAPVDDDSLKPQVDDAADGPATAKKANKKPAAKAAEDKPDAKDDEI